MDMKTGCRPGGPCGSRTGHQRARGGLPGIQPGSDRRGSSGLRVCGSLEGGSPHGADPCGPAEPLPFPSLANLFLRVSLPKPTVRRAGLQVAGEDRGHPTTPLTSAACPLQRRSVPDPGHSSTPIPSSSGRRVASGLGEGGDTETNVPLQKGPEPV